jgi:hypothetical protein
MSPASYRAAPPRVGIGNLMGSIDKDQIHELIPMNLAFIWQSLEEIYLDLLQFISLLAQLLPQR